ncbi:iron-sulfur cluster repair di-iron protein [Mariniphaga sediminis]|uniref:Iron-sulfur cluster repair di-iron protein n=1 Tax=Mariniphaga sediminis TaxID=1628158 RepID=A0A399CVT1_9BACT|nr:iron-sulfur cluster repair di-iron protein [Mariniphaga sediminis]RIH63343.1 iron-sulfur cluster repair di-iron protein [Mariniphaga sediminis]
MKITSDTPVGEIVKTNFKAATTFQANKIDYCCGGNQSVSEACAKAGVEMESLIDQLEHVLRESDPDTEYINNLDLGVLADYIVNRHHSYVQKNIPFLKQNLDKIAEVHGANHPELVEVRDEFYQSAGELTMHMQKEELLLFPYVKQMEQAKKENKDLPSPPFGTVANPISAMMAEHENEGERYERISKLTNNYQIPEDGCTTYEVTLKQLADFEKDLHRHIHLENNILFPKAKILEENF